MTDASKAIEQSPKPVTPEQKPTTEQEISQIEQGIKTLDEFINGPKGLNSENLRNRPDAVIAAAEKTLKP